MESSQLETVFGFDKYASEPLFFFAKI